MDRSRHLSLSKGFLDVFFIHTDEIGADVLHFFHTTNDFSHLIFCEVDGEICVEYIISVTPVEMLSGNKISLFQCLRFCQQQSFHAAQYRIFYRGFGVGSGVQNGVYFVALEVAGTFLLKPNSVFGTAGHMPSKTCSTSCWAFSSL